MQQQFFNLLQYLRSFPRAKKYMSLLFTGSPVMRAMACP
jgi:hypothetical protein